MKILVVDDEIRIARAIKQGLEQDGYAVDLAYDGEDGYNSARADEYDCIILDVMMPEIERVRSIAQASRRWLQNTNLDAHCQGPSTRCREGSR
ncbi:MAG TPA: response regulator [Patescibacteria group bacterium]|nr:response regulator [Patescibacteria group bacterium]